MEFQGTGTGGVYGVLQSLQTTLWGAPKGNKIISVWDGGKSERRKQIYPEYKDNRNPKTPEEKIAKEQYFSKFAPQQHMLKEFIFPALGICNVHLPNKEGDDTLFQVVKLLKDEEVLVISEDKDNYQLIQHFPKVKIYRPVAKQHINNVNFEQEVGMHPSLFLLSKALLGDKSDGISGIEGVGAKTVEKIIQLLKPNADAIQLKEILKSIYDEDMTKRKGKLTKLGKVYGGWGTICRNLDLVDISREQFLNSEIENINQQMTKHDYSIHKDLFFAHCRRLGFTSIITDFDSWISSFNKFN
jgi:5'-3' exonuclease